MKTEQDCFETTKREFIKLIEEEKQRLYRYFRKHPLKAKQIKSKLIKSKLILLL